MQTITQIEELWNKLRTSSGACLMNDVILHIANKNLPFRGVGESV